MSILVWLLALWRAGLQMVINDTPSLVPALLQRKLESWCWLSALGSCSGEFVVWLQPCKFLQSNSCDVFQVTFPGLMSSLSDEHMVCCFPLVKGAGGRLPGILHKLSFFGVN